MAPQTLEANLIEELSDEPPDDYLGPIRLARRLLLRGETLNAPDFRDAHQCSISVVGQAVFQLKALGYEIDQGEEERLVNGRKRPLATYRVTNPEHRPGRVHYDGLKAKALADRERSKANQRKAAATEKRLATLAAKKAVEPPAEVELAQQPLPLNGHASHANLPALPSLGRAVNVYALALNDDGTVTLGLRDGDQRWITTVNGTVE